MLLPLTVLVGVAAAVPVPVGEDVPVEEGVCVPVEEVLLDREGLPDTLGLAPVDRVGVGDTVRVPLPLTV